VHEREAAHDLPEQVAPPEKRKTVRNRRGSKLPPPG
jgi:hypothetical protein